MPQHDMNIGNDSGANVRSDLNDALAALVQNSSGATEPSTMFAHQFWADTSPTGYTIIKVRNAANAAWATCFDDEGRWKGVDGSASEPSMSFGSDVDLGLYRSAANTLGINASAGIGINTGASAPQGTLHVEATSAGAISTPTTGGTLVLEESGSAGITIFSNPGSGGYVNFGDFDNNVSGRILYNHVLDRFIITAGEGLANENEVRIGGGVAASRQTIFNARTNDIDFGINGGTINGLFSVNAGTDNIGIGIATPNSSAILEISSTVGAVLFPRMTDAQRNALTPVNGMMIYNSTDNVFQGYENGGWVDL